MELTGAPGQPEEESSLFQEDIFKHLNIWTVFEVTIVVVFARP